MFILTIRPFPSALGSCLSVKRVFARNHSYESKRVSNVDFFSIRNLFHAHELLLKQRQEATRNGLLSYKFKNIFQAYRNKTEIYSPDRGINDFMLLVSASLPVNGRGSSGYLRIQY